MAIDSQQRHLGGLQFEDLRYPGPPPQFTNPWASSTSSANAASHIFPQSLGSSNVGFDALAKSQAARSSGVPAPYSALPVSQPSMAASNNYSSLPYGQSELLNSSQDLLNPPRSTYDQGYSAAPTSAPFAPLASYGSSIAQQQQQQQQQDGTRRLSPTHTVPVSQSQPSFSDALDASRGMVAMSQDMTPRNIYAPRGDRGSTDSYGFPSSHSSHSSISSASTYPSYFGSSADGSVTDYSSASECMEPISSRTLPRPTGLVGTIPPAPQSMMGQFNSKVSSSTQKKHKCKICDKRFTRPSSLQTHMYSHTGEKRKRCTLSYILV